MGPPSPVTVPTTSWSGRNGLDREPSGASLMRVSRAGSLASRTTNSWWARSSAGFPLSRVSRYWRASSFSPFRAAFRKPRTVPRGVLRPRGSGGRRLGGARLCRRGRGARHRLGEHAGRRHDESEDSSQQRWRQRLQPHFQVQTTSPAVRLPTMCRRTRRYRASVFGGSSRPPTEFRRPPDLPDGNGPRRPAKLSQIPFLKSTQARP